MAHPLRNGTSSALCLQGRTTDRALPLAWRAESPVPGSHQSLIDEAACSEKRPELADLFRNLLGMGELLTQLREPFQTQLFK